MTDVTGAGQGDAQDATVSTDGVTDQEDPRIAAQAAVDAARNKVEKQRGHLAAAEEALTQAQSELDACEGA